MSLRKPSRPVAIDPPGCGCTECMTGEYVPLERATAQQVLDLFAGHLRDNTGNAYFEVIVHVNGGDYTWTYEAAELIDAIRGGVARDKQRRAAPLANGTYFDDDEAGAL